MIPQNSKLGRKEYPKSPPPPHNTVNFSKYSVTSSVSCWPSGVKYSIPVILVRVSEGATHTSFEVSEQASF